MNTMYKIGIVLLVVMMTGCAAKKQLKFQTMQSTCLGDVMPSQLVMAWDSVVHYSYTLRIPPKGFDRGLVLRTTPILKYGDKEVRYPSFYLQGQRVVLSDYPVVKYRRGIDTTYQLEFRYKPGMENAVLWMETEGDLCGKERWLAAQTMNSGGIKAPVSAKEQDNVFHPNLSGEIRSIVMFPVSKSTILSGKDYMKYVKRNLDTVLAIPGALFTGVQFIVSCSPDGEAWFNKELGEERYKTAKAFFEQELGLNRIPNYNQPGILSHQILYQNWQGLYDLIEDSKITNRYDIISELKQVPDAEREKMLVSLMNRYPIIKDQYLPLLRSADMIIYYQTPWHPLKTTIVPGMW